MSDVIRGDRHQPGEARGLTLVPSPTTHSPVTVANLLPEIRDGFQGGMSPTDLVLAIKVAYMSGSDRLLAAKKKRINIKMGNDATAGSQLPGWSAGTDMRRFWHAPDPPHKRERERQERTPAGTNELTLLGAA